MAVALPLALASCGGDYYKDAPVEPLTEAEAWGMLRSYWEITPCISVIPSTERGKLYKEQSTSKPTRASTCCKSRRSTAAGKSTHAVSI